MTDEMWEQVRPTLVHQMLATLEDDPRILLETDGGPVGLKADVYLAVLIDLDEQIHDVVRITRAEPVWLQPIMQKVSWRVEAADPSPGSPAFNVARYILQSFYATYKMDHQYAPSHVRPDSRFQFTVALLRYKRRL
jgi:hypothetical protein